MLRNRGNLTWKTRNQMLLQVAVYRFYLRMNKIQQGNTLIITLRLKVISIKVEFNLVKLFQRYLKEKILNLRLIILNLTTSNKMLINLTNHQTCCNNKKTQSINWTCVTCTSASTRQSWIRSVWTTSRSWLREPSRSCMTTACFRGSGRTGTSSRWIGRIRLTKRPSSSQRRANLTTTQAICQVVNKTRKINGGLVTSSPRDSVNRNRNKKWRRVDTWKHWRHWWRKKARSWMVARSPVSAVAGHSVKTCRVWRKVVKGQLAVWYICVRATASFTKMRRTTRRRLRIYCIAWVCSNDALI